MNDKADRRQLDKRDIDSDKRDVDIDAREVARDIKTDSDTKTIKDALLRNFIWVITTLVTLGVWIATIQFQGKSVEAQGALVSADHERIIKIEQTELRLADADERVLGRFTGLEARLKDLKDTLEKMDDKNQVQFAEIKKILYKPAISSNTKLNENDVADVAISVLSKK